MNQKRNVDSILLFVFQYTKPYIHRRHWGEKSRSKKISEDEIIEPYRGKFFVVSTFFFEGSAPRVYAIELMLRGHARDSG